MKKFKDFIDTFTHNDHDYDLARLKVLARDISVKPIEVAKLVWIFQWDKPIENRILTANINQPILVTYDKGKLVILDGLHRLTKAVQFGFKSVPGKMIPNSFLKKTIIGEIQVTVNTVRE